MIKSVLYMGGMAGDLVVACLAPNQLIDITTHIHIDDQYCFLKEYWAYDMGQRKDYLHTQPGILSSHDTQLHRLFDQPRTLQLICSDHYIRQWMATRFFDTLTDPQRVIKELGLGENYVNEYESMITNWQTRHAFAHRLDVKNILTDQFIMDLAQAADLMEHDFNITLAQRIHDQWLDKIQ